MTEKRVLCVGTCVLDMIHLCAEYPQEDIKKRCLDGYWQRGGNASNSGTVLSKLGAKCEFLGVISTAPAFQFIYEDCQQRNILIDNCPSSEMNPPFSSVILVKSNGSRTIIHSNPGFPNLQYEDFRKINLDNYSWIHFEGRNVAETKQMIDMVQNHNSKHHMEQIKISVELENLNEELFQLATRTHIVFVSKDLAKHMGWSTAKEAVYKIQNIIADLRGAKNENEKFPNTIICPWGSECSVALDCVNQKYYSVEAVLVEDVVDSLGAGDTFVAAVIYAINSLDMNLADAVNYGNRLAAFKIQHKGYDCVEEFKM